MSESDDLVTLSLSVTEEINYAIYATLPAWLADLVLMNEIAPIDLAPEEFDQWLGDQCSDAMINCISSDYITQRVATPHTFIGVAERLVTRIKRAPVSPGNTPALPLNKDALVQLQDILVRRHERDDAKHVIAQITISRVSGNA